MYFFSKKEFINLILGQVTVGRVGVDFLKQEKNPNGAIFS